MWSNYLLLSVPGDPRPPALGGPGSLGLGPVQPRKPHPHRRGRQHPDQPVLHTELVTSTSQATTGATINSPRNTSSTTINSFSGASTSSITFTPNSPASKTTSTATAGTSHSSRHSYHNPLPSYAPVILVFGCGVIQYLLLAPFLYFRPRKPKHEKSKPSSDRNCAIKLTKFTPIFQNKTYHVSTEQYSSSFQIWLRNFCSLLFVSVCCLQFLNKNATAQ